MAITLYGVDPSIDEARWAELFALATSEVVSGLTASAATGTRLVGITTGSAVAAGVLAKSDTSTTVTLDAPASTNRIDLVVLEINWTGTQSTGGTIKFVKGTAATTPTDPALTKTPGVLWQVPLARVTVRPGVTQLLSSDVEIVRPSGRSLQLTRVIVAAGQSMGSGNTTPNIIGSAAIADPGWPYRLRVYVQQKFTDVIGGSAGNGQIDITIDDVSVADGRAPDKNMGVASLYYISNIRTGSSSVVLRMLPVGMAVPLATATAFRLFTVEVEPA